MRLDEATENTAQRTNHHIEAVLIILRLAST